MAFPDLASNSITIQIDSTKIDSDLTDFPLAINVTNYSEVFAEVGLSSKKIAVTATISENTLESDGSTEMKAMISASSEYNITYPIEDAFDGVEGTNYLNSWISGDSAGDYPDPNGQCWVQFDYGISQAISEIRFRSRPLGTTNNSVRQIRVLTSDTGDFSGEETDLGIYEVNQVDVAIWSEYVQLEEITYSRYIRIEIHSVWYVGALKEWVAINEISFKVGGTVQNPVEIECWEADNQVIHTKIPLVSSSTNTIIKLWYDNSLDDNTDYVGDTGSAIAQTVWDDNFVAVYHMAQDPSIGGACILDSTSNVLHGTPEGSMLSEDLIDGEMGKAINFDGSNDNILVLDSVVAPAAVQDIADEGASYTIESATNALIADATGSEWRPSDVLFELRQERASLATIAFSYGTEQQKFSVGRSADYLSNDERKVTASILADYLDTYAAVSVDSSDMVRWILNGIFDVEKEYVLATGDCSVGDTIACNLRIGARSTDTGSPVEYFVGSCRELRLSSINRVDAWLKATNFALKDELISEVPFPLIASNSITLEIDHTKIDEDLTDFPLAINVSNYPEVFTEIGLNEKKLAVVYHGAQYTPVLGVDATEYHVGVGQTYTTIADAVSAVCLGGVICIHEGTYNENVVFDKHFHLKGIGAVENIIILNTTSTNSGCLLFDTTTDAISTYKDDTKSFYIENLTLEHRYEWRTPIRCMDCTDSDVVININKCYLNGSASNIYTIIGPSACTLNVRHSTLNRGYAHITAFTGGVINLYNVELDNALSYYNSTEVATVTDIVIIPTTDYGYDYGSYIRPVEEIVDLECPVEIECWEANTQVIHTKIPLVSSSTDTVIKLWYDNSLNDNTDYVGDTGSAIAQSVWDDDFVSVYHMAQDPSGGVGCVLDSTANELHGTPSVQLATLSRRVLDTTHGYGYYFDGDDDSIDLGNDAKVNLTTAVTLFADIEITQGHQWFGVVSKGYDSSYDLKGNDSLLMRVNSWGATAAILESPIVNYVHNTVAGTYSVTDALVIGYLNGFLTNSTVYSTPISITASNLKLGTDGGPQSMQGNMYEFRLSRIARSAAWIKATNYALTDQLVTVVADSPIGDGYNRIENLRVFLQSVLNNFPLLGGV